MGGNDDAGRSRALRAPADRPEVARVAHLVETGEERPVGRGQLVGVRVLVGLAPGEHALVVARAGGLGDVLLELHLHARLAVSRSQASPLTARSVAQSSSTSRGRGALRARGGGRRPARASSRARASGRSGPSCTTQPSSAIRSRSSSERCRSPWPRGPPRAPRRAPHLVGRHPRGTKPSPKIVEPSAQQLELARAPPLMQHRERLRRIEVVVERRLERLPADARPCAAELA